MSKRMSWCVQMAGYTCMA